MVRLNDIKNFVEASSFPSISMASKKMRISQPALSESIKRLESDLGRVLFYRTKTGVSLTPDGKRALEDCLLIQKHLKNLVDNDKNEIEIRIGCHTTIGNYFLPKFLNSMQMKNPSCGFSFYHDLSRNVQLAVQSGEVDFAIIVNPVMNPDLILKKAGVDYVRVWKSKKAVSVDRLIVNQDLIQTQEILKKWKHIPNDILHESNLELIARMTNAGNGYGIFPERLVHLLNLDVEVVENSLSYKDEFYIVYRPEFGKNKFERMVIKNMLEIIKSK